MTTLDEEDFEHKPTDFVGALCAEVIFIGMADREAFDRIAAPVHDHGLNESGHVLTKMVQQDFGTATVRVIFQYWIKRLTAKAQLARARTLLQETEAAS